MWWCLQAKPTVVRLVHSLPLYFRMWLSDFIIVQLVVKPRNNVIVAQPISHYKWFGFIARRMTVHHPCYSHRDSSILLLGNAGIRLLGYVEGSDKDMHNGILLKTDGI